MIVKDVGRLPPNTALFLYIEDLKEGVDIFPFSVQDLIWKTNVPENMILPYVTLYESKLTIEDNYVIDDARELWHLLFPKFNNPKIREYTVTPEAFIKGWGQFVAAQGELYFMDEEKLKHLSPGSVSGSDELQMNFGYRNAKSAMNVAKTLALFYIPGHLMLGK